MVNIVNIAFLPNLSDEICLQVEHANASPADSTTTGTGIVQRGSDRQTQPERTLAEAGLRRTTWLSLMQPPPPSPRL